MKTIRFGVIGTGYMGKAHAVALNAVGVVFNPELRPTCEMICATTKEGAANSAKAFGFNRSTDDWRALVDDSNVDAVVIATPPATHCEMALRAIERGKPVLCEKPLSASSTDSLAMAEAAETANVPTMVGFNYIKTPASQLAKEIIDAGEIGEIVHIRAEHVEDYMLDPDIPASWRTRKQTAGIAGALADVGSHVINAVLRLVGPIDELVADSGLVHAERMGPNGPEPVDNDDHGHFLARFANGALGSITYSRAHAGRKMGYTYWISGTKGAIAFDQENQNELHVYQTGASAGREGFKRLLTGPDHPDYLAFCQGPAHGTGYNDQIIIEMKDFLAGIAAGRSPWPSFRDGAEVDRIIAAVLKSRDTRLWIRP